MQRPNVTTMKERLIGREREQNLLNRYMRSGKSEFIALYGRRRVGKTFLIRKTIGKEACFTLTGMENADLQDQLANFHITLSRVFAAAQRPSSWIEAFYELEQYLEQAPQPVKIVVIDELPWLDTVRSKLIGALEHFWNAWASARSDIKLIVCGSATSWMINHIINNYGGLYGRLTSRMKLAPFTLSECERFFQSKGITLSRYDIAQGYMVVGGIPYYLDYVRKGLSLAQNIDRMFFADGAKLRDEYDLLFASVFSNPEQMKGIVQLLGTRHSGFTRQEILAKTGLDDGGAVTKLLKALEVSDFIKSYVPFGKGKRDLHYKLTDPFCLFHLKFVQGQTEIDPDFWMHNVASQSVSAWRGIAFEELCFSHIGQIKKALDILGVSSKQSAFVVKGDSETEGMQIDLLIDRKDNVLNLCEMKFVGDEFEVDNDYEKKLRHRLQWMLDHMNRKQSLQMTLVTTFGLKYGYHSGAFQQVVTLDQLF